MQLNDVTFSGFVGKDATEHTTPNGVRIVSFNMCHTAKGKNGNKDVSTWMRFKVFGNWCDTASQIKKGDNVIVRGSLSSSEYTNKEGVKVTSTEVIAHSLGIIKKDAKAASEAKSAVDDIDLANIPF